MNELKPCPFCGHDVKLVSVNNNSYGTDIVADCDVCNMTFTHRQNFATLRASRVAINEDFLTVWNRRGLDEEKPT